MVGNFGVMVDANDYAIGLARTGAFFSNDQAPLSSRTVRFISGIHFPPGVRNKPPAALYGIENTNRGCDFGFAIAERPARHQPGRRRRARAETTAGCGTGIVTGKADLFDSNPTAVDGGGVPIFKDGRVAGGIGVSGMPPEAAEFAAFAGSIAADRRSGHGRPSPAAIFLDGIRLPFVKNIDRPAGVTARRVPGTGAFIAGPIASPSAASACRRAICSAPIAERPAHRRSGELGHRAAGQRPGRSARGPPSGCRWAAPRGW